MTGTGSPPNTHLPVAVLKYVFITQVIVQTGSTISGSVGGDCPLSRIGNGNCKCGICFVN